MMNPVGDVAGFPLYDPMASFEAVQAALEARALGDGLPMVPPTPARLADMLSGVKQPHQSAGPMPPLFGDLRVDAVAYQCVLAGAHPSELPVVWAAAKACLNARFNLLGLLTTTGTPAVGVVVHGEAATRLGINASSNCLGPGNRANACIGRALSLTFLNVAGARPGVADMATMGQPGKFGLCFAEANHRFARSLAERRGLSSRAGAVTVIGLSGTTEVLPLSEGESPEAILIPMAAAMAAGVAVSSGGRAREPAEQLFLLPPELADRLHGHDWSLERAQAFLFDTARVTVPGESVGDGRIASSPTHIHPVITGGPGVKMTSMPAWAGGTESVTVPIEPLGEDQVCRPMPDPFTVQPSTQRTTS